jgi:hypothetical protein
MPDLKPISVSYLEREIRLKPGERLHRIVARMCDSYIDDLTDEAIVELEKAVDDLRLTSASGQPL